MSEHFNFTGKFPLNSIYNIKIQDLSRFTVPVSQVQVAAAASAVTGAPLHVATPMAQYLSHYPQAHPQTFQAPYAHMVRIRVENWIKNVNSSALQTIFFMGHLSGHKNSIRANFHKNEKSD